MPSSVYSFSLLPSCPLRLGPLVVPSFAPLLALLFAALLVLLLLFVALLMLFAVVCCTSGVVVCVVIVCCNPIAVSISAGRSSGAVFTQCSRGTAGCRSRANGSEFGVVWLCLRLNWRRYLNV
jgi:hypothetical protein